MRIWMILTGTIAALGALLAGHQMGVGAQSTTPPRPGIVVLSLPTAPAQTTKDEALAAARADGWGHSLAQGTNMTMQYGSWASGFANQVSLGHVVDNAARDTWAITVGGLNISSHPPIGQHGVVLHYMTVFVDDATRKVVLTKVY